MDMRNIWPILAPAGLALLAGGGAHLVWGAPLATVLASAIAAFAGALAFNRAEHVIAVPPSTAHVFPEAANTWSSKAWQPLLEALPLGLVLVNRAGEVVQINAQAKEIFGPRPSGVFHAAALRSPKLLNAVETSLSDRTDGMVEFSLSRGNDMHFRAHIRSLEGPAPEEAAVLVAIEDITLALRAEELHRDFVANASHELKTPLAAVSGIIETLQGPARDDPEATERFLAMMAQQSDRMRRLVEDLLSLNRIEINARVLPREAQSLSRIVADAADAAASLAREAGVSLDVELPETDVQILGSHLELCQAFENLIENGIRHGNRGGDVAVRFLQDSASQPGKIGVAVIDNGPGIAREDLPRLTERFFRVSTSRSRARGGTGLGLAIVKHIVSRHRGRLSIESTLGEGSKFTVWLPVADEPAELS